MKKTMTTEREQFEAWAKGESLNLTQTPNPWGEPRYFDHIQCMWQGWQAARTHPATPDDALDAISKALSRAWSLGQTYWQQTDSESFSQNRKSEATQAKFKQLVEETRAALAAPAQQGEPHDEMDDECQVPPLGWRCTRGAGHEGPCAAVECPEDVELVRRGMERLREATSPAQPEPSEVERISLEHAAKWQGLAQPEPVVPATHVLVPKRMTQAMSRAVDDEGWQWEDLLAAAEAITEQEYEEIAAAPQPLPVTPELAVFAATVIKFLNSLEDDFDRTGISAGDTALWNTVSKIAKELQVTQAPVQQARQPLTFADGWYLPADALNEPMRASLAALVAHAKRARWTNATVRKDAKETTYEADWIKALVPFGSVAADVVIEKASGITGE